MRRLTFFVVFAAFVLSSGAQWPILQAVAWVNMIREYSEMVPFSQAVQMTLSGQHPCALCRAIAEKKQSENSRIASFEKHEKKLIAPGLVLPRRPDALAQQAFRVGSLLLQTRTDAPPTPPPRLA